MHRLGWNKITSVGASEIFQYLCDNSFITSISLERNLIDESCLPDLIDLINKSNVIRAIYLDGNALTDVGVERLIEPLSKSSSIRILGISGIQEITEKSAPALLDLIMKTKIEKIHLSGTSIISQSSFTMPSTKNQLSNGSGKIDVSNS